MTPVLARRRAGVLLHPTSLPGPDRVGTLGSDAYRFVDFLAAGGFSLWQTLPLGPVDELGSPYCLRSAHAADPRLIDAAALQALGEVPQACARDFAPETPAELYRAFEQNASERQRAAFVGFARAQRRWLLPYALFRHCERHFTGAPWWHWPEPFRDADPRTVFGAVKSAPDATEIVRGEMLLQYLFDLQWSGLKRYARERGIYLFGDLPMYVDLNGVDVWWHRGLFRLTARGRPEFVAGVPPDYFNADGQRWGNPLYDWERMRERGFVWWIGRIREQLRRFDLLRIDHFRALDAYWEIPAAAPTAREGRWRPGAGDALLTALGDALGALPLVAEDLGIITDSVRELRDRFGLPGMAVLQFAFDGSLDNPHLPAQHVTNSVVYTGTHDNDTTLGWFEQLDPFARELVRERLGVASLEMPETLIEAAYGSRAQLAVVPMQDLLALGSEARMNTPGVAGGNWSWRFDWSWLPATLAERCRARAARHDRCCQ